MEGADESTELWRRPKTWISCSIRMLNNFVKYSTNFTINDKYIDGVLGSRTRGGVMEGADKSTELWRHPLNAIDKLFF